MIEGRGFVDVSPDKATYEKEGPRAVAAFHQLHCLVS